MGQNTSKIKQVLNNICQFIKRLLHRFIAWIQNVLSRMGILFAQNHKMEVAYVNKHKVLNHEIFVALQNGTFNPEVKDWPNYNIQLNQKTNRRLTEIVEGWLRREDSQHMGVPTVADIKREFYPKELGNLLIPPEKTTTESYATQEELEMLLQEWAWNDEEFIYEESIMYQEAVEVGEGKGQSKPIYICFTIHKNAHSKIKDLAIKDKDDSRTFKQKWDATVWDKFTEIESSGIVHAAIAMEPSLRHAYTYRIYGEKSGFTTQDFSNFYTKSDEGIVVYVAYLDSDVWRDVKKWIDYHDENRDKTKYAGIDIMKTFIGFLKRRNTLKRDDLTWCCSTFVNAVLEKAGVHVEKLSERPRPAAIKNKLLTRDDFTCVYIGPAKSYDVAKVIERTNAFAARELTKNANESDGTITGLTPNTNAKEESPNVKLIRNYFLYNSAEPRPTSNKLTSEMWETLIKNITETGDTFESELKLITEDCKLASTKMQSVVNNLEQKIDGLIERAHESDLSDDYDLLRKQLDRSRVLLQAVNEISREYTTAYTSIIRTEFFKVQYRLYRDTLSVYKSQV